MAAIRFETNIPQEVMLQYPTGKDVEGRYGPQVLFTLANGDTMYVPPIVATKIENLGVRPGERIEVVKREMRDGRRKGVEWEVARLDAPEPQPARNGATVQSNPVPAVAARQQAPNGTSHANGTTHTNGTATNGGAKPEIVHTASSELMLECLCAAIDAAIPAQKYAERKGMALAWNEEDIRCIASSIYIQRCRMAEQRLRSASWQQ